MNTNKYNLLNKIVLFISQDYIERSKRVGMDMPPVLTRLEGAVMGYKTFHMFTIEEAEKVVKMSSDMELKSIMDKHISFIVFVMEIMKLWTEEVPRKNRPHLNISDKHFKLGGKSYWKQMLSLKKDNTELYDVKQNIIDDSITVAREFMDYHTKEAIDEQSN